MKILIKRFLIFLMWYPLRIFIKILPLNLVYLIGVAGGHLLYLISKEKHNIMSEELRLIMPDKRMAEIEEIIKGSFKNYCISEIEVLLYPLMNRKFMKKIVTIEGKEHLDNALSKGKGVLLFQAHFDAFQMVMPAVGYSGYKMSQISASASVWKANSSSRIQEKSFDIKAEYEYSLPVHHISVKSSLRPAFRALENNEIVGITIDGGGGKKVVSVRFLGRDANFQQGGADIAIRTGAVIVPAFIITEKGLKHRVILHPPIEVGEMLTRDEKIRKVLQEFAAILEGYVYRYPAQYGYSLYLRRVRASVDPYPFFTDHNISKSSKMSNRERRADYS